MAAKKKSGKYWVTWANSNAKNSKKLDDLAGTFKTNAKAFVKALEDAGATVDVSSTLRAKKRAYLFHWSWKIVKGKCKPSDAEAMSGVDIEWDHGDDKASKKGAKEMTDGFGLDMSSTKAPSLTSNHIAGKAMDIDITWSGTIKVKKKDGTEVAVKYTPNPDNNKELIAVGESYGVKKLKGDPPHWSHDGK